MGYQIDDAAYSRAELYVLLRHLIQKIRGLLWSGIQKQEEEIASQEEKTSDMMI